MEIFLGLHLTKIGIQSQADELDNISWYLNNNLHNFNI